MHLDARVGRPPPPPQMVDPSRQPSLAPWHVAKRHCGIPGQFCSVSLRAVVHLSTLRFNPPPCVLGRIYSPDGAFLLMQHLHTSTKFFFFFPCSLKLVPAYIVHNYIEFPSLVIQSYAAPCSAVFNVPVFRLVYCTFFRCRSCLGSCGKGISG